MDGTTLLVADTKENPAAFGKPGNDAGAGALPQVRVLGLAECGTRALLGAAFGGPVGPRPVGAGNPATLCDLGMFGDHAAEAVPSEGPGSDCLEVWLARRAGALLGVARGA
jgi:hypothetical protein